MFPFIIKRVMRFLPINQFQKPPIACQFISLFITEPHSAHHSIDHARPALPRAYHGNSKFVSAAQCDLPFAVPCAIQLTANETSQRAGNAIFNYYN